MLPASAYLVAQQSRRVLIDELASVMAGLDAVLTPAAPIVAPPLGLTELEIRGERVELRRALLSCVLAPSEPACPVVSVPVGSHCGLPFGMQIIGPPETEARLLGIAAACERRWPWEERRPSI